MPRVPSISLPKVNAPKINAPKLSVPAYAGDAVTLVLNLWYAILVIGTVFFIGCIVVAAQRHVVQENSTAGNSAIAFVAVWSMLIFLGSSIFGTLTLKSWQTHFTMGVFLGLCTMLMQFYLTLFALFVSFSMQSHLDGDGLVAAFSFLLFLLFAVFTVVLLKTRNQIVTEELPLPPVPSDHQAVTVEDVQVESMDKHQNGQSGEINPVDV